MEEAIAQLIISKVLENKWKVKLSAKPSGPDFLYKGKAVEVKGSNIRFVEHVSQFARYAHEYEEFALALPHDTINTANLLEIHAFSYAIYSAYSKFLKLFIIAEEDTFYRILELSNASELLYKLFSHIKEKSVWKDSNINNVKDKLEQLIRELDIELTEAAKNIVFAESGTSWVYKDSLQANPS